MTTKYFMLPSKKVERLMDTFLEHRPCINEKFEAIKSKDNPCISDRDRFVYHYFNRFIGKYIQIMDRVVIGWHETATHDIKRMWICNPTSMYDAHFKEVGAASPIIRHQKKFLFIRGFSAINTMYGSDYVEMQCFDLFNNSFKFRIDHNNLLYLQFKEITELEYNMMANLFSDDRENIPYKVERFIQTTVNPSDKRKKPKTIIVKEELTVMAKDEIEARHSTTNVLGVTRIEDI